MTFRSIGTANHNIKKHDPVINAVIPAVADTVSLTVIINKTTFIIPVRMTDDISMTVKIVLAAIITGY